MTPVLQLSGIHKRYQSLRPLRLRELTIAAGECVAVSGFDAGAAEVLVNLVTGASLPDEGEVRVLGQLTADISGGDDWLASLDRFGIVSPRGVLLEGATIEQNLALPLTLSIDPVPPEIAVRVARLAQQVGIEAGGRGRVVAAGDRRNAAAYPGTRPPRACRRARAGAARPRAPGRGPRGEGACRIRRLHCGGGRREYVRNARHHQRR